MSKLKVLSLFSGIGAFEKALSNLNIDFDLVGFSEIDKYAIESYCAIHNVDKEMNLGDVSKVKTDTIADFDLMTYGFPCQDISIAGRQRGFSEDSETRSSLLWEAMKIAKVKKPKYMIAENVKNLIGKKFKEDFDKWLNELDEMGYNSYYKVLNAKGFNIPQNRERVFVVSIRKDVDNGNFEFPIEKDHGIRLKDILEESVEEKYYLSEDVQKRFKFNEKYHKNIIGSTAPEFRTIGQRDLVYKTDGMMGALVATDYKQPKQILVDGNIEQETWLDTSKRVYNSEGIAPTLPARNGMDITPKIIVEGSLNHYNHDIMNRVYSKEGISPTLDTMQGGNRQPKVIENSHELQFVGGIGNGKGISRNYPQGNRVYDTNGIACSQTANSGGLGGKTGLYIESDSDVHKLVGGIEEDSGSNSSFYKVDYKIRKLTPKECWRLMGFTDEDFHKAKSTLNNTYYKGKDRSDSQLYKQAGNSIVVNVAEALLHSLLIK